MWCMIAESLENVHGPELGAWILKMQIDQVSYSPFLHFLILLCLKNGGLNLPTLHPDQISPETNEVEASGPLTCTG